MFARPYTPSRKALAIAEQLRKLDISEDIEVFGPKVVSICEAAGTGTFMEIDEREMYWGRLDGRFPMVRQVRNHAVWGKRLFAALAQPRRRRRTP